MDFTSIIGSLQLALAAFQLKLDHFKKPANRQEENDLNSFYDLGKAIRTLEFALAETVSFVGQTNNREPNQELASLWADASSRIRKIGGGADLAGLTFEKSLYWRNPEFYRGQGEKILHRISLDNVLVQLRHLRTTYDKLQKKVNG
jgi:hypothetical protein